MYLLQKCSFLSIAEAWTGEGLMVSFINYLIRCKSTEGLNISFNTKNIGG